MWVSPRTRLVYTVSSRIARATEKKHISEKKKVCVCVLKNDITNYLNFCLLLSYKVHKYNLLRAFSGLCICIIFRTDHLVLGNQLGLHLKKTDLIVLLHLVPSCLGCCIDIYWMQLLCQQQQQQKLLRECSVHLAPKNLHYTSLPWWSLKLACVVDVSFDPEHPYDLVVLFEMVFIWFQNFDEKWGLTTLTVKIKDK